MDRREARHPIETMPKIVRRPVTRLSETSRGGMLLDFSYQEQHLTCFVCSSIHVYDHVVARWTLEGALSCPILVPKLSLSSTIAGARSWPRTIYPPLSPLPTLLLSHRRLHAHNEILSNISRILPQCRHHSFASPTAAFAISAPSVAPKPHMIAFATCPPYMRA